MKIDVPIVILFDCQATDFRSIERAAGKIIGTLRYDTEGDGTDASLYHSYPPPDDAVFWESAQPIMACIPQGTDKEITKRSARSPYDYMVGTEEEREMAQAEVDAEREASGQFGVGA